MHILYAEKYSERKKKLLYFPQLIDLNQKGEKTAISCLQLLGAQGHCVNYMCRQHCCCCLEGMYFVRNALQNTTGIREHINGGKMRSNRGS